MKFQRTSSKLTVQMEGAIGETTPLFNLPLAGLKEIELDMTGVTSINSIGIKQWISWTVKIPTEAQVKMHNCPFVIGSQASMVVGFCKSNMKIESLRLPYICDECEAEHMRLAVRGKDFDYATATTPSKLSLPDPAECPKCKKVTAEPDFILEKTFKFLELPAS